MNAFDFAQYSAIDAVNWSTLKELRRSPLRYQYRLTHPRTDTPSLAMGRAVHTAVFEPDRFAIDYAVFKGEIRRGKEWEAFRASHSEDTILKLNEYERCLAIRDAVRRHPLAMPYLAKGKAEVPIQWRDDESGLNCKGRIDFLSESKPAIVDLKTTASIGYGQFASTAYKLGYHCQLGFYREGVRVALGKQLTVMVIAVEAEPPHDVAVFEYLEDCLDTGLDEVKSLLLKLSYHRERNEWPGMYEDEQLLEFPAWVTREDDENVSDLGLED